jgi:hypothetical protein
MSPEPLTGHRSIVRRACERSATTAALTLSSWPLRSGCSRKAAGAGPLIGSWGWEATDLEARHDGRPYI